MADKDVLGKADALLKRHSGPAADADAGDVPVLTDLVEPSGGHAAPADPLTREVLARVMAEVEGRLAGELERRVAQQLVPHVHAAVAAALDGLREDIASAVEQAVAEALRSRPVK